MPYINTNTRTVKPVSNEQFQPMGRLPSLTGVFLGFVKRADDVQRNGRLQVWIPEFGSDPEVESGWITVNYCSPFAGATNVEENKRDDIEAFDGTQTSYGMWMIPPDINNQVLVMFVNGDPARGIWIGCLYNQFMNNMVPAQASDIKTWQFPGEFVPAAEYNKWDLKVTQPDRAFKPFEETKFKGVGNQGLIKDKSRGVTATSARREAPSSVFGILTPGPVIDESVKPEEYRRKGGSSFIMDDKTDSEYIELATKTGAKIRIDESNGFVYAINRDGTAWIQMDYKGNIDVFSAGSISMRAQQDLNIRADRNVNIEAGQNIFMKAAMDTVPSTADFTYDVNNKPQPTAIPVNKYVGEGAGVGGNIVMQAWNEWHSTTEKNTFITNRVGNLSVNVNASMAVTTVTGSQEFTSDRGFKFNTKGSYDLNVLGDLRASIKGKLSVTSVGQLAFCTDDTFNISAKKDISIKSDEEKFSVSAQKEVSIKSVAEGISEEAAKKIAIKSGETTSIQAVQPINLVAPDVIGNKISAKIFVGPTPSGSAPDTVAPVIVPPVDPLKPETALIALTAAKAEVKPLNSKINVLATFADPDKFVRDSESVSTTVTRFPTFEPCPEHDQFSPGAVTNTAPPLNETDKTYEGSGAPGNDTRPSPPPEGKPAPATQPGAENKTIPADESSSNAEFAGTSTSALECQLKYHEGVENKSYRDSLGYLTGGVGHLLREDEKAKYPEGSPIPQSQIDEWYKQDVASATKVAQNQFSCCWNDLSETRKRALIDLSYNLGPNKLAQFKNFKKSMCEKDYAGAAAALKDSKWYGQVGRRGPNIVSMIGKDVDPTGCGAKHSG